MNIIFFIIFFKRKTIFSITIWEQFYDALVLLLSVSLSFFPSLVSDKISSIIFRIRREKTAISRINDARREKVARGWIGDSREVGFIFIAAIRRDSTPGVVRPRRRQGPTSLGQSVAVVIINDATSNATSAFPPPPFLSSCLLPSPLFYRSLLPPTRHCCLVSFLCRFGSPHSFWDPRSSGDSTGCLV